MWTSTSWLSSAGVAIWLGLLTVLSVAALVVALSAWFTKCGGSIWERRLTDCESLLSEQLQTLSRIDARDRMRQVRAARTEKQEAERQAQPAPQEGLSELPTAEVRRRLAMRLPIK